MKRHGEELMPILNRSDEKWVLILERTLKHPIEDVWAALTESDQLPAWGPFATDRDLVSTGAVTLSHVNHSEENVKRQGEVLTVEAPHLLIFKWGNDILRWELISSSNNTVLILRHRFTDYQMAPSLAAGWTLCLKGLTGILDGKQMPSMAGSNAVLYGWQELHDEFKKMFESEANR
ncbi:SRPBCC family protein [Paenibacillus chondroitinus]|uniref:SRPBCC family protein n=1 Tax=Paenibacillus chondroitinus TaxID=59842 RepID=A0ABU6DMC7_9BACL|nr:MULTISPECIES: SRPBCC family protein [Paenibacillus]MCY9660697.1 SRPBCC family protein [Paenibacillus anseongense]MEB4798123.1 SRPBCC family protein [Paenibacillus chondroitinus]